MAAESYVKNPGIVLRTEEDGAFLFDPDSGKICYVNAVGITIWQQCRKPVTLTEIVSRVTDSYADVPQKQAHTDCRDFIKNLETLGFLNVGSGQ